MRPSAGSGVARSMPASRSAAVLTQAPWWSRLGRNTGRSPTTASRAAARGPVGPKAGIAQPPPSTQAGPGAPRRRPGPPRGTPPGVDSPERSQRSRSTPPWTGCTWASWKPGCTTPPARSTTSAPGRGVARRGRPPARRRPPGRRRRRGRARAGGCGRRRRGRCGRPGRRCSQHPSCLSESVGTPAGHRRSRSRKSAYGDGITCIGPARPGTMGHPPQEEIHR